MSYPNTSTVEQAIDDVSSAVVLLEHAAKNAEASRHEVWNLLRLAYLLKGVQVEMNMHLETRWWDYPEIGH